MNQCSEISASHTSAADDWDIFDISGVRVHHHHHHVLSHIITYHHFLSLLSLIFVVVVIIMINLLISDMYSSIRHDQPCPEIDFIYTSSPLPPELRRLLQRAGGDTSGSLDSGSESQNVFKHDYNHSLHDYVTIRKCLRRQQPLDEEDSLSTESLVWE